MVFGYFDLAVILILVFVNVLFWGKKIEYPIGCLIVGLIFGLILPLISQKIEIGRVGKEREILDNFTLLYTFLKFPIYWLIGAVQLAMISNNKVL